MPQAFREGGPELQHPPPHRLARDVETALRQQILNVAVAQCSMTWAEIGDDNTRSAASTDTTLRPHSTATSRDNAMAAFMWAIAREIQPRRPKDAGA